MLRLSVVVCLDVDITLLSDKPFSPVSFLLDSQEKSYTSHSPAIESGNGNIQQMVECVVRNAEDFINC